ncbi:MAG: zinc ribbon domain-containing protein [Clostridia bacterium]|nr:zinc ribbon domain-containing protein [Clostridia bacterium]
MFCTKCGKELSDQARFCNYCGAQMETAQPQAAPAAQPVQRPAAQPAMEEKPKKSIGKTIVSLAVAALVFFVVRQITYKSMAPKPTSSGTQEFVVYNQNVTNGCSYGALYQDDYLTYGMARLHMPGFSHMPDESRDWLISSDNSSLFSVDRQLEVNISYDASDRDGILKSYIQGGVSDASMAVFRKYMVNGSPVILYIVRGTVDGTDEYIGELIIFPNKEPSETLRLSMVNLASIGYGRITQVFDTLEISPDYTLSAGDTQGMGYTRITAK